MLDFIKKEMEQQEKMKRRADILYPSMKIKDSSDNKKKFIGLGKSIFDNEDNDENTVVKDYSSDKSVPKTEKKEKDYQKTADILYPTMKDKKDEINEIDIINLIDKKENSDKISAKIDKQEGKSEMKQDKKEMKPEKEEEIKSKPGEMKVPGKKQENLTGGAANINDNKDKPEMKSDKKETLTGGVAKVDNTQEETKRKHDFVLKELGLGDKDEYEIKDNTISPKKKEKQFDIIDNVKYPKNTGNPKVDVLKKIAENDFKERRNEYLSNGAKKEQYGVDNVGKNFIRSFEKKLKGIEATENLYMSKKDYYMNTDYAKKHKVFDNYEKIGEVNSNLKDYFRDKIIEQIGKDKLNTTKGIFIDSDSESSKSLAKALSANDNFLKKAVKYRKALEKGYFINETISFSDDNWHNAIGNADIRDMHINKNGDLEMYICDVYDFNEFDDRKLVKVGRDRQEKGEIIPYYFAYHVIIPKDIREQRKDK